MKPIVASALLSILLSTGAHAATVSYSYGPTTSTSINIAQFDPSLGTLQSAHIDVSGDLLFPFIDNNPTPTTGTYSYHAFYSFYYFNTYHDYGVNGAGTATFGEGSPLYLEATGSASFDINSLYFSALTGTGTFFGTTVSDPPSNFTSSAPVALIPDTSINPIEKTALKITYTYDDGTGAVPEPAAWAMMIAGFGMVGVAMRRRGSARTVTA